MEYKDALIHTERALEALDGTEGKDYLVCVNEALIQAKTLEERGLNGMLDLMKNTWISDVMKVVSSLYADKEKSTVEILDEVADALNSMRIKRK